ncbi:Ribosomal_protein S21 [Hexamita inflata]|uniref:40S ribosomal protein S21 n=1 Tax=Hexamita inflata TaxID=28002 RepID=A0AA86RFZ5_9EUKA|nr:Ribosomal protein S21 [Hexamita inflata]CAI9935280.1 Ribosomal protein S21 [Hexamita inflata]CAI9971554.1 Ribosomal protein S21 [Hexamita inflata]
MSETIGLHNAEGQCVDLYIPRKCSATNRLIGPQDHASIQIKIAELNENGVYDGKHATFAFCGALRHQGQIDAQLTALAQKMNLMKQFK